MTYTKTALVTGSAAALLLAGTAHAGDMNKKAEPAKADKTVTQTTPKSQITYYQPAQSDVVLGVMAYNNDGTYTLRGEDGRVYENHYVPEDDLLNVSTDVKTVDTYTFEYNGRTYTNKVTADK